MKQKFSWKGRLPVPAGTEAVGGKLEPTGSKSMTRGSFDVQTYTPFGPYQKATTKTSGLPAKAKEQNHKVPGADRYSPSV